jgi:tetratricopeptide (TPR) repeat protein
MARSPLVLEAVECAHCGAKVREDRVRCLRCGKPLLTAAGAHARHSVLRSKLLVGAGVLVGVGLVSVVIMRSAAAPVSSEPVSSEASTELGQGRAHGVAAKPPGKASNGIRRQIAVGDATRQGDAAYASSDFGSSLDQYRGAVEADPDNPDALNKLGQVLVRSGRPSEAIAVFDRAIAIASDKWAYHFNRARAYAELQNWDRAVSGYRDALALFPDDYATQFNLAKALQAAGDLPAAIQGFERAIELAPGQPDFHLSHGLALEAAQRPTEAAAAYKRFLELAPEAPEADRVKGRIAQLEGATTPASKP